MSDATNFPKFQIKHDETYFQVIPASRQDIEWIDSDGINLAADTLIGVLEFLKERQAILFLGTDGVYPEGFIPPLPGYPILKDNFIRRYYTRAFGFSSPYGVYGNLVLPDPSKKADSYVAYNDLVSAISASRISDGSYTSVDLSNLVRSEIMDIINDICSATNGDDVDIYVLAEATAEEIDYTRLLNWGLVVSGNTAKYVTDVKYSNKTGCCEDEEDYSYYTTVGAEPTETPHYENRSYNGIVLDYEIRKITGNYPSYSVTDHDYCGGGPEDACGGMDTTIEYHGVTVEWEYLNYDEKNISDTFYVYMDGPTFRKETIYDEQLYCHAALNPEVLLDLMDDPFMISFVTGIDESALAADGDHITQCGTFVKVSVGKSDIEILTSQGTDDRGDYIRFTYRVKLSASALKSAMEGVAGIISEGSYTDVYTGDHGLTITTEYNYKYFSAERFMFGFKYKPRQFLTNPEGADS